MPILDYSNSPARVVGKGSITNKMTWFDTPVDITFHFQVRLIRGDDLYSQLTLIQLK